jgi:hypothetical protein
MFTKELFTSKPKPVKFNLLKQQVHRNKCVGMYHFEPSNVQAVMQCCVTLFGSYGML